MDNKKKTFKRVSVWGGGRLGRGFEVLVIIIL
jgi:hypothetical protein